MMPANNHGAAMPEVRDLYAARTFKIDDGKLVGPMFNQPIVDGEVNIAQCPYDCETIPSENCSCGWYAFYRKNEYWSYAKDLSLKKSVKAVVRLSGRICVYERGFRAEKMEVIAICGSAASLESLKENYPHVEFFDNTNEMVKKYPPYSITRKEIDSQLRERNKAYHKAQNEKLKKNIREAPANFKKWAATTDWISFLKKSGDFLLRLLRIVILPSIVGLIYLVSPFIFSNTIVDTGEKYLETANADFTKIAPLVFYLYTMVAMMAANRLSVALGLAISTTVAGQVLISHTDGTEWIGFAAVSYGFILILNAGMLVVASTRKMRAISQGMAPPGAVSVNAFAGGRQIMNSTAAQAITLGGNRNFPPKTESSQNGEKQ